MFVQQEEVPVRNCLVRLLGESRYLLFVLPTGQVWHKTFLGGSRRRSAAQTRPVAPKMPWAPSGYPKNKRLKRHAINLTHPRRVRAWGDGPLRQMDTGQCIPLPSASKGRTHPARPVYRQTKPTEVYPSPALQEVSPRVSRVNIYKRGRVYYRLYRSQ